MEDSVLTTTVLLSVFKNDKFLMRKLTSPVFNAILFLYIKCDPLFKTFIPVLISAVVTLWDKVSGTRLWGNHSTNPQQHQA